MIWTIVVTASEIVTGKPYVLWYAKTNKSALALDAEYGLDVCSGVSSVKNKSGLSNGKSP